MWRRSRAVALAELGKFQEATDAFRRVQRLDPLMSRLGTMRPYARVPRQECGGARGVSRGARLDSLNASIHWHIGVAHYRLGRVEQALDVLSRAAAINPNDPVTWSYLGVCAATLGRHAVAVSYWDRALKLKPDYFTLADPGERRMHEFSRSRLSRQP